MHRDPTFDAACRMEVNEKSCAVCQLRVLIADRIHCGINKKFPFCKKDGSGFLLDMGDA